MHARPTEAPSWFRRRVVFVWIHRYSEVFSYRFSFSYGVPEIRKVSSRGPMTSQSFAVIARLPQTERDTLSAGQSHPQSDSRVMTLPFLGNQRNPEGES